MVEKTDVRVTELISRYLDIIFSRITPAELAEEIAKSIQSFAPQRIDLITEFFIENAVSMLFEALEEIATERFQTEVHTFLEEANVARWDTDMIFTEIIRSLVRNDLIPSAILCAAKSLGIANRIHTLIDEDGTLILREKIVGDMAMNDVMRSNMIGYIPPHSNGSDLPN